MDDVELPDDAHWAHEMSEPTDNDVENGPNAGDAEADYDQHHAMTFTNMQAALESALPKPIMFTTEAEIDNLTYDQAYDVLRATRRMLLVQLMSQEYHEHMLDDCGDYLSAATDNWAAVHELYFVNDGERGALIEGIQKFLRFDGFPMGGSDGEIRNDILSEELFETLAVRADQMLPHDDHSKSEKV